MRKNILDSKVTIVLGLILKLLFYPKSLENALRLGVMSTIKKLD